MDARYNEEQIRNHLSELYWEIINGLRIQSNSDFLVATLIVEIQPLLLETSGYSITDDTIHIFLGGWDADGIQKLIDDSKLPSKNLIKSMRDYPGWLINLLEEISHSIQNKLEFNSDQSEVARGFHESYEVHFEGAGHDEKFFASLLILAKTLEIQSPKFVNIVAGLPYNE